jgi:uncharacterized membrane protein YedE/YeeE
MTVMILIFGFLFGAILQYAKLNKYNVISGLALRENFAVPKAIAVAIGVGAILLNIEIGMGMASYHVKPFVLGGIVLGGLLFGAGMAILGYCPGTLAISLGEGSVDALVGIIGGLVGGVVYTLLLPSVSGILGPNLGAISLNSLVGSGVLFYVLLFIVGAVFIAASFMLNRIEKVKDNKWLYAGIALAILNVIVFGGYATNRPIGASTTFPYLADLLTGVTDNAYFGKIQKPGNWELIFLAGAFLAGLIISLIKKDFKITTVYSNWEKYKGSSVTKRVIWAFVGGFILIIGARMAGGCTSGHLMSGIMQTSLSGYLFALSAFAAATPVAIYFYQSKEKE